MSIGGDYGFLVIQLLCSNFVQKARG